MITHLNSVGIGSNGTVTEADARNATTIPYVDNDVVTKFNELRYFTNINKTAAPRRGEDETGSASFNGWAALEEIDISNYVSVGRYEAYSSEWCLRGMPALTTVIASNKLKNIGYGAFAGDNNLETISGLSGLITLRGEDCFLDCWKLLSSNFTNV
ncbi:MAG: leucine-rich repeat protein [Prevotella sp.]|nr:leucine-rich repeat protein [Prevotella sp.]